MQFLKIEPHHINLATLADVVIEEGSDTPGGIYRRPAVHFYFNAAGPEGVMPDVSFYGDHAEAILPQLRDFLAIHTLATIKPVKLEVAP